jgi:hypothetical protein
VASAAGAVDPQGPAGARVLGTAADLAASLQLAPGEDLRLVARLGWLLTTRVDVDRLGRQTAMVPAEDREGAGHYLIRVAFAADPAVGPATVAVLTRVYRILGLAPELVFQRLHEHSVGRGHGGAAAARGFPGSTAALLPGVDEPVVVQVGGSQASGYTLPWAASTPEALPSAGAAISLDPALISRTVAESSAAAALLSSIFDDESPFDPDPEPAPRPAADGRADQIPGLDPAHGALLHALAGQPSWTREEFASLAAAHGVLPDGALDLLNEVAIDTTGAPLVEGDVTLTVANDILLELLA